MPLITCPDCKRQISDSAPACIHCGRPNVGRGEDHSFAGVEAGGSAKGAPGGTSDEHEVLSPHGDDDGIGWEGRIAGIIGFLIVLGFFRLESGTIESRLYSGAVMGVLLGLIPYVQASRRGMTRLAVAAIVASTVLGALGGLVLVVPACVIFTLFIRRQPLAEIR